jgi:hypothetical protein
MKNPRAFTEDLRKKLANGMTLDDALAELRASGASILQCIIAVNLCRHCGLNEAKKLVNFSPAWADVREKQEQIQREVDEVARNTPIMTKIIQHIIVIGLFGICIGIVVRGTYLSEHYYLHAPRQADAANGFVFPTTIYHHDYNRHYTPVMVYLTETQWRWFSPTSDWIFAGIFCVALVSGFILGFRWNILRTRLFGKTDG